MAENATTGQRPEQKPAEPKPTPAPQVNRSEPDEASEPGFSAQMAAAHEARTVVPTVPDADARLDSRSADMLKPPPASKPDGPKPQHTDGPDLAGQVEHTAATLAKKKRA